MKSSVVGRICYPPQPGGRLTKSTYKSRIRSLWLPLCAALALASVILACRGEETPPPAPTATSTAVQVPPPIRTVTRISATHTPVIMPESTGSAQRYAEGSSVTIRVDPDSQTVPVNETLAIQVVADLGAAMGPAGLAGYEFVLVYDPTYLKVIGATDAGQLSGPNSRTVGTLGPDIDNATGKVTFGAYSFHQTIPQTAGPTGTVVLAEVTLKARQTGTTTISLENALVTDTQATIWPDAGTGRQVITQSGTVSIETSAPAPSPTVKPSITDTPLPAAPPTATSAPAASPTSPPSQQPTSTPPLTLTATVVDTATPITTDTATPTFTLTPVTTNTAEPTFTLTPVATDTARSK